MTEMTEPTEILVVGSINIDLSLRVDRFALPGETVLGRDVTRGGGGKGANQAVAAARLGRRVMMAGAVGDDGVGGQLLTRLAGDGIDVDRVEVLPGVATGLAVIEVDASGENRIVVASGANAEVTVDGLAALAPVVAEVPVILTQLEIPLPVVSALASMPRRGRLVVNPAPADPAMTLDGVDIVVPNRGELAALAGADPDSGQAASDAEGAGPDFDAVVDQARSLDGALEAVVVTLGGDGALVIDGIRSGQVTVEHVAPVVVDVVDTTAAGDAFCGGLADALCMGADLVEAARWAAKVAAVTVTRRGAQDSLPTRPDVLR